VTSLERGRAAQLIRAFGSRKVLVVGDVMLDRFVWGGVQRISPEAPVPVVVVEKETSHPGGAANVAANLASLGARVRLASAVGSDAAAGEVRECLVRQGIEASLVEDPTRTTTLKTRVLARAQQVVRVDRETAGPFDGPKGDELRALVVGAVETVDAVVVRHAIAAFRWSSIPSFRTSSRTSRSRS
jgi:D-beta-D-heptose 7-phosphate kinase/D-beta-D-heptose 1-phosphate adenosyltransferase